MTRLLKFLSLIISVQVHAEPDCTYVNENDIKIDHYECLCPPGWTGRKCTEEIDECLSNPCMGKVSNCFDYQNGYFCECQNGFVGENCEIDVDECASKPCRDGAGCVNGRDLYKCICPRGWTGVDCYWS